MTRGIDFLWAKPLPSFHHKAKTMRFLGFLKFLALFLLVVSCSGRKETAEGNARKADDADTADTTVLDVREIVGVARIEPAGKIIVMNAETAGFVREVLFVENDRVQKGQSLVVLDAELEEAQVQQAKSRIVVQQAAIESARARLSALQVKFMAAKNTYERELRLLQGKAGTQQALEDSRFAKEELEKQILAQEAQIRQQQAQAGELAAELRYREVERAKKTLRAPLAGRFLSCEVKPGNYLSASASLGDFAVDGPQVAVTEVDELFAMRVREGLPAYIRPQGRSEVLSRGKVVFVGPYLKKKSLFSDRSDNLEDRRVREVRVELEDSSKILIGSRVECVISLD